MPYRTIDDPVKLRRLLEAVLLLEADLSLPVLLRHFVEEARSMVGARYAALGVLDAEGASLAEFITVGLTAEQERTIGRRPTGRGVLGILISDPRPLRLPDIAAHPGSAGFPAGHPPMTSFLGVPVTSHDQVYGNLYLTDKAGGTKFTVDDEALALALAQAAGIAIENARLNDRVRDVAVLEDRDRIARDLHDAVIQRLFAIGLSLQGAARPPAPPPLVERLQRAVADLDETIRQIRSSIFELAATGNQKGVRAGVLKLVQELRAHVGAEISVLFEGPVDSAVSPQVEEHLLLTVREALTNVARHAWAARVTVTVTADESECTLEVVDDGLGLSAAGGSRTGGLGIGNLRRRAEKLGGTLVLDEAPGGGTSLMWRVPT